MERVFVIGDIHGSFQELELLLTRWDSETERLIFLGDYINRGKDSLSVLQTIKSLVEHNGAIALMGNHEAMFLEWLNEPYSTTDLLLKMGGATTIESMSTKEMRENESLDAFVAAIKTEHASIVNWLKTLPLYYRWHHYFFVHAGINPEVERPESSTSDDFLWIRDDFTHATHEAKETVVFGHTPTMNLNEDESSKVWISSCKKKIGIDGGVVYPKGRLNGIVLHHQPTPMRVHFVQSGHIYTEQFIQ
ncbi:metallophosphoesterase family protein [Lysinibacillus sp. 54212]|uniref:metallophosphoesterase family protein n=1 Tax=Lysinibacillus sp. 54212 TaxID=3119829 RepID=UPI002FC64229